MFPIRMSLGMSIEASPWLRRFCVDHAVILGSSSQWRRKVLLSAGCRVVDAIDPNIDERAIRDSDPEKLVVSISHAKADAILSKMNSSSVSSFTPETYLICTDQVAVCEGKIREKPESESEAREFIRSYSEEGKPVNTCSGVVVVHAASGKRESGTYWNSIQYGRIPEAVVDEIVKGSVVYTCCGGFSVDCPIMGKWVESIEGSVDGVMGMPLALLEDLFRRHVSGRLPSSPFSL